MTWIYTLCRSMHCSLKWLTEEEKKKREREKGKVCFLPLFFFFFVCFKNSNYRPLNKKYPKYGPSIK